MEVDHLDLLQSMPIFGGIAATSLELLLAGALPVERDAREYFFREGAMAESMFVLERGRAQVAKLWDNQEHPLRILKSGDCFGEVALLDMMPRSASVQALDPCHAIEIPRAALYALYQENLEQFTMIIMNMAREVSRRLRLADNRLFEFSREQPAVALAQTFRVI